ncbi:MAG: MxaH protein [Methylorubrum rhodinum]|uniref:MxaH protein n=1 Tax=Methylorubrum rhodinum TaxID=29428 RepID=UPI003BAFF379
MRRVLLLLPLLTLAACGSEEPRQESQDEGQSVVARTSEGDLPGWLTPTDGTDPARWLAGREAGRPLPDDAPEVAAMRASLKTARTGFVEDPRMMANRTVQLGQMLAEIGKPEPYRSLIDGLNRIAAPRGRHKSLYGEMVQHYYNARAQGADHDDALARLASRATP